MAGGAASDPGPKPERVTLSYWGPNIAHDGLRVMTSSSHFCRLPLGRVEVMGFGSDSGGSREILGVSAASSSLPCHIVTSFLPKT